MINICRFCKIQFPSADGSQHSCDGCIEELKTVMVNDEKLKLEVVERIIQDETVMQRFAKAIAETPIRHFGLGGEGTFAEFFRKPRKTTPRE